MSKQYDEILIKNLLLDFQRADIPVSELINDFYDFFISEIYSTKYRDMSIYKKVLYIVDNIMNNIENDTEYSKSFKTLLTDAREILYLLLLYYTDNTIITSKYFEIEDFYNCNIFDLIIKNNVFYSKSIIIIGSLFLILDTFTKYSVNMSLDKFININLEQFYKEANIEKFRKLYNYSINIFAKITNLVDDNFITFLINKYRIDRTNKIIESFLKIILNEYITSFVNIIEFYQNNEIYFDYTFYDFISITKKENDNQDNKKEIINSESEDISLTEKEKVVNQNVFFKEVLREKDKIIKNLKSEIERLNSFYKILDNFLDEKDYINYKAIPYSNKKYDKEGLLLLSDIHYGAHVDIRFEEENVIFNKYDKTIAAYRLKKVFEETKQYIKINNLKRITVVLLGDIIHGIIHDEYKYFTESSIINDCFNIANLIATGILELSEMVELKVIGLSGNHGRLSKKIEFTFKQTNNLDYLVYRIIETILKFKNIDINIPENTTKVLEILDRAYLFHHGDMIRGGNNISGAPAITGSREAARLFQKYKEIYPHLDTFFVGHFHTTFFIPGLSMKVFGTGSLMGTDSFANENALISRAAQTFIILTNQGISSINIIDVNDILGGE